MSIDLMQMDLEFRVDKGAGVKAGYPDAATAKTTAGKRRSTGGTIGSGAGLVAPVRSRSAIVVHPAFRNVYGIAELTPVDA
jgi:hypothetical protein